MKKMVNLLLVLTMVLSLFSGCGNTGTKEPAEMEATQPAQTPEPTEAPTTEPTLILFLD